MKKLLIFTLFVMLSQNSFAYTGTPEEQVEKFFKDASIGKTDESIENLFSSNPMMTQKIQQLNLLKQQFGMLSSFYGETIGIETYNIEEISESIRRIVMIQKFTNHPIVWEFYFYKPNEKWMVSSGKFNDQFGNITKNN